MSYLRLIKNKMQNLAETMASVMNVEVAIADSNLTRIVGTGDFCSKLDENCAEDSLYAKVVETGQPIINLTRDEYCSTCSNKENCYEFSNMSYPIKLEDEVIGVISFASFNAEQANNMRFRRNEYFNMLKETAAIVEREIFNIKIANKLINDVAEVNEIINCLNTCIIILNSNNEIIHINSKALDTLNLNISSQKIINRNIFEIISNIKLADTGNKDLVDIWKINGKEVRVKYSINKLRLRDNRFSLMISFEYMQDIINIAKTYENREKIQFKNIIGKSRAILEAINKSKIAASTDSTVLIQGASGTGKELFARSIHNEGLRKDGPFVAINCGSIPETLIESELFGYERGAFTGASSTGKKGKIELAHNGTLFLDEVGELPLYAQTKLLRVLQERTIDRIGGTKPVYVNIRVIAATNKDLKKLVDEGKFRLDLFYRLNVIPIKLPDLKDREDDVLLCADHILDKLCYRMNVEKKELSEEVKLAFKQYHWPGNIRELENVLEYGVCFSKDKYIKLEDLPEYFLEEFIKTGSNIKVLPTNRESSLEDLKLEFEKKIIEQMLDKYGNTVEGKRKVAEKLNIGLTTLYRKINDYYK